MNNRQDILNELASLSPGLVNIPTGNVFSVPEGYFDQISDSVCNLINNEVPDVAAFTKASVFSVPGGYFDNLANDILARVKGNESGVGTEELEEVSPVVLPAAKTNVFTVPLSYFEELPHIIMGRIAADGLVEQEVWEETTSISGTVASIGNRNVFSVPAGYFDSVEAGVRADLPTTAKVVQMQPRKKLWQYAAAAVVTALLGMGVYQYGNDKSVVDSPDSMAMADAKKILRNNSFDAEFDKISASEIENFLTESGQDVNAALVANAAIENSSSLPGELDYMIDEKTLDEYLTKMNLNKN